MENVSETNELKDWEVVNEFEEDAGKTILFSNIEVQIEKQLADIKLVVEDLNKMRERAAILEADLLASVNSTTWQDISALIGMAPTTMISDCINILGENDTKNY